MGTLVEEGKDEGGTRGSLGEDPAELREGDLELRLGRLGRSLAQLGPE